MGRFGEVSIRNTNITEVQTTVYVWKIAFDIEGAATQMRFETLLSSEPNSAPSCSVLFTNINILIGLHGMKKNRRKIKLSVFVVEFGDIRQ